MRKGDCYTVKNTDNNILTTLRGYFLLAAADLALYPEGSPEHIRAEHSAVNTYHKRRPNPHELRRGADHLNHHHQRRPNPYKLGRGPDHLDHHKRRWTNHLQRRRGHLQRDGPRKLERPPEPDHRASGPQPRPP